MIDQNKIVISDLQSLQLERQRLQLYCVTIEHDIKHQIENLRNNYSSQILVHALPFGSEKNEEVINILNWINQKIFGFAFGRNSKFKTYQKEIIEAGIRIAQVLIIRKLVNHFKSKKNEQAKPE